MTPCAITPAKGGFFFCRTRRSSNVIERRNEVNVIEETVVRINNGKVTASSITQHNIAGMNKKTTAMQ